MGTKKELEEFLKRNKQIVYKPVSGLAGTSVKRMASKDIKDINAFYKEITEDKDILLEGFVEQHHEIAEFAKNSCNTIRVMTFGYNGHSEILCAIMRFGNGIADVDNFHQGGMGCIIDQETGKVVGDAINKDLDHFKKHPKSGIKFDGFQIPNWDIVKKTVLDAALVNDHIHVVGWDVAVTEDGCTLIEGNRRPGFDLVQVDYDRGRKDIMRDILKEINENEGTNYKI
jgi:glutathione synthase/RimK-type ligase-like ATP-grasp enzyme